MAKINAVRLININYNNNSIRINDETMHFNGDSTLVALANGGGKTVLVQMMTAPFVHKRYRNTTDRMFENFFTTNKPSFILIEWSLDGGIGKMMNGLMIRRSQNDIEDSGDALEITGIVSEYNGACMWDIHNLPVVEKTKKEMNLKGYATCRQIFDGFKKDRDAKFFHYDMNNSGQQRQYFDKLMEYRVDYKEWEDIIRKINMKEGGLAELFSDCKDERSLMEKWFLESIEKKIDKDGGMIRDFERNVGNYVRQYYENEDKIKRRDTIEKFKEQVIYDDEMAGNKSVKTCAEEFLLREKDKRKQEGIIAAFRTMIEEYHDDTSALLSNKLDEITDLKSRINDIRHEKISYEILLLSKDKEKYEQEYEKLGIQLTELDEKINETELLIGIMACRRIYDTRDREKKEYNDIEAKLRALSAQNEDNRERREELGALMYAFIEENIDKINSEIEGVEKEIDDILHNIEDVKGRIADNDKSITELSTEKGKLEALVETYSDKESTYNRDYKQNLCRNILGKYDEGLFDIEKDKCLKSKLSLEKEVKGNKEKRHEKENALRKYESDRNNISINKVKNEEVKNRACEDVARYDKELDVRRNMLKYVELNEDKLFDRELIRNKLDEKLEEIDVSLSGLKTTAAKEKKEYEAISQGRIYELPDNMKTAMDTLGIAQIHGLNWLRKNGKSAEENIKLVRRNPFIPYALIMTDNEYASLKNMGSDIYSSLPVPIMLRKELEEGIFKVNDGTLELGKIRFYVRFNENLLDENKMQKILDDRQHAIKDLEDKIQIREDEKREYNDKLGVLNNQEVTDKLYEEKHNVIKRCEDEEERLTRELASLENAKKECESLIEELNGIIQNNENDLKIESDRYESLKALAQAYDKYIDNVRDKKRIEADIEKLENYNAELKCDLDKYQAELGRNQSKKNNLTQEMRSKQEELSIYLRYGEMGKVIEITDDHRKRKDKYESEYKAITEELDNDIKRLERDFEKQVERLRNAENDYKIAKKKLSKDTGRTFDDIDDSVKKCVYDEDEDSRLSEEKKDLSAKRKDVAKSQNEADKNRSLKAQSIENKISEMKRECGRDEPVDSELIIPRNYEAEISGLCYNLGEVEKERDTLSMKIQELSALLSGLAEYSEFRVLEDTKLEVDVTSMNKTELDRLKGSLVRDYSEMSEKIEKARNVLEKRIRDVLDITDFHDEYYKKHLDSMLRLSDTPSEVLRQIELTISVFDNQMKKIEVDLALVEKERNNLTGELMDYVKAVHRDVSKIDDNSTITVRERSIKMLDIKTPDWQENEELYNIRMREFVDGITLKGVELYKKGENAAEYFGTQLNTKNLYDIIVGLGNVSIRLYKIEEQREYPIAWSDVAANSGGEGFLSSFVILSSLLTYIRKDDTDLFAEKNESKVMIMDNPFGVTYSEHLLKPLMEMAKKNNTQLICLSGLGGDSIYGRFDNIYILNRVVASLKSGQQFLRMEHYRGTEPETIIASQFEVGEQLTLF